MSGLYRNRTWNLLFRMTLNGASMITFMKLIKKEDMTLVVV